MFLDYARLTDALRVFPRQTIPTTGLRPAAVLLPLFRQKGRDRLLFTLRTDQLEHHSGEISFPGGASDKEDADLMATALRETEEEIGLPPHRVQVLGRLDDFYSIHGYHVVPFVGVIPQPSNLRLETAEIAAVFDAPLGHFQDPSIHRVEDWTHKGRVHPVDFYQYNDHVIWGLTAAILRQFLDIAGMTSEHCSRSANL